MKVSELTYENITKEQVDRILYEGLNDNGQNGDCIMVLGSTSSTKYRVPKAIEVFQDKRAQHILVSGGTIHKTEQGTLSEAASMKQFMIEHGIPHDRVLLEDTSRTTKENMICSLVVLDRAFRLCNIKKILLVTTRYHMRRSLLMAKTYMPKWIEFVPCPADDKNTLRHNWHLTEQGYKRATNEAYKISCYIREGSIEDFEI